jgi:meiotic recombination protein REC8, fungi type
MNGPYSMPEGDPVVDMIDVRLRSSSLTLSRLGSPLPPSRGGSLQLAPGFGFSPAQTGQNLFGEDFAFDGKKVAPCQSSTYHNAAVVENAPAPEDTQQDTQKSDLNLISLERNSFNFLESVSSSNAALLLTNMFLRAQICKNAISDVIQARWTTNL